jgi:putative DNA primase/helicase
MKPGGGFSTTGAAQPVIWASKGKAHLAADQAMQALQRAGRDIYARGPQLVYPCRVAARATNGGAITAPGVLVVGRSLLQRELAKVATWQYQTAKGEIRECDPPEIVVNQLLAMVPDWTFSPLVGTTATPFLRHDGNLVATEGFDPASGFMLMDLPAMPPIPNQPTKDDAARALKQVEDLLDEFPFATDVDKSVGLSLVMTPTLRPTIDGWAPLHALSSPEPGTGKSFLLDIAAMIAIGAWCPVIAATRDPEELDKKLTAALLAAMPMISIDNVNRLLSSDLLAQAVERPTLTLRPLGTSQNVVVPNISTIGVNGNNLHVVDDLVRRTLQGVLDANCEDPERRTFKKNPLAMVRAERGCFIASILTVARAYLCAGYPEKPVPLPSFEPWSDLVRGALIWLGRADPAESIARSRADDPHKQSLVQFLNTFPTELTGYTAAELVQAATEQRYDGQPVRPDFLAAVRAVATDPRGNVSAERLGYWLRSQQGRVAGEWKLVRGGSEKRRVWSRQRRDTGDKRDGFAQSARESQNFTGGTEENSPPISPSLPDDEGAL